ncbi:Glucose-induced degradation protein 8-like isoform B [Glycine soja]|uniref:Glucose-induced degradation protein 8-like isoform B n=1 Tax=Glycine soja TaxID=3848 RepID=A0A445GBY3_GLYSO|nr:Glucose-induced degradation protein 8-like isoform B [Glycine soja]
MDVDPCQYEQIAINEKDVNNIILSYLIHNCYKESSESFISCTGMKQPADHLENMEKRKRIFHHALEGNVLKAIELTGQLAQDILENNNDLLFDLLSLHFVDLVCSKEWAEALEFAQTKLSPFSVKEQKYMEKIEVCLPFANNLLIHECAFKVQVNIKLPLIQGFMSLLAYENPVECPMFHLIGLDYRQQVVDSLNQTILAHFNLPIHTAMERLIQQTSVVRQCLSQEDGGPPPFSLKDFLKSQ